MHRRELLKGLLALPLMLPVAGLLSACAPLVSPRAHDPGNGRPWRCTHCGHLTRSLEDISEHRCPRCGRRRLRNISEEEMTERLARAEAE
ncbi:MAG: hypothetical protein EA402_04065 [Planctomycetota bacterium]|nr:MAG: hypothetical protein EA402_04065 [Planctomycetota bacterium]